MMSYLVPCMCFGICRRSGHDRSELSCEGSRRTRDAVRTGGNSRCGARGRGWQIQEGEDVARREYFKTVLDCKRMGRCLCILNRFCRAPGSDSSHWLGVAVPCCWSTCAGRGDGIFTWGGGEAVGSFVCTTHTAVKPLCRCNVPCISAELRKAASTRERTPC
jgi:hypothetical protein